MKNKIAIHIGDIFIKAALNDTKTAKKILDQLPLESEVSLWGEEIYFSIPVKHDLENQKDEVDIGELAFWPQGSAFCIFFGKTPASVNDRPRPISPVTPIGKISNQEAIEDMKKVKESDAIKITFLND